MKQLFLLFISLSLPLYSFGADCSVDVPTSGGKMACVGKDGYIAQAFKVCQTGLLKDLSFNVPAVHGAGGSFTVYVAKGTQADKTLPGVKTFGPYSTSGVVTVAPDISVETGEFVMFWVELTGFSTVCFDGTNNNNLGFVHSGLRMHNLLAAGPATGSGSIGVAPAGAAAVSAHTSLAFNATIAQADIPTLNQWGLLIFGLLTVNLGLFFVKRKEEILQ